MTLRLRTNPFAPRCRAAIMAVRIHSSRLALNDWSQS